MVERREELNKYIQRKGAASIAELERVVPGVSSMTIRRDLKFLEGRGDIVRTRGGAKSIAHLSSLKEDAYASRAHANLELKMEIAAKAASLLDEGTSIYLDSGTTVMCIAKQLGARQLFVTTSGPNIGLWLLKNHDYIVNIVGGQLSHENLSLSGPVSLDFIAGVNIEVAILAASGFSPGTGFTCGNYYEASLKRAVLKKARSAAVVMDSTKLGVIMPFTFAGEGEPDMLITDSGFDPKTADLLIKKGVRVI